MKQEGREMKGFGRMKTIQMIITLAIMAAAAAVIFLDPQLFQMAGSDPGVRAVCILFWLLAGVSLVFLLLDLRTDRQMRRENEEMNYLIRAEQEQEDED